MRFAGWITVDARSIGFTAVWVEMMRWWMCVACGESREGLLLPVVEERW